MSNFICGIQQVGIGTNNLHRDWKWYRQVFNMDIRIFEDAAEAPLMTRYTGGDIHSRSAALAMNMQGGGGFEIWQYSSRTPQPAPFEIALGDTGILAIKMKTRNAAKAYEDFKQQGVLMLTPLSKNAAGIPHFFMADTNGYWFEVVEKECWFKEEGKPTGGVYGAVIGVSNMEKSMAFYRDLLGFDKVLSDTTGFHDDLFGLPGCNKPMRRVLLGQSTQGTGYFTPLLGTNQIELIQRTEGESRKIFHERYWGDLGFIHICFDVCDMAGLKQRATELGYHFTVDSDNSFDMGKAAGRFSYVEDPDHALIEFVETHKIPIVEKWGWYLNLRKMKRNKSLPTWMLGCFRFNRVKN